jgi:4'-phosphopantetheinyl transferase
MKHIIYFHYLKELVPYIDNNNRDLWISKKEKDKLSNFHRELDKNTALIGKLLLRCGLNDLGYSADMILDTKYTEQKRPYLDIPWDFNITHCDDYIAIVFAEQTSAGIDAERIDHLDITDFQNCFTCAEWNDILTTEDQYSQFYYYWTRKEAVLKAIGSGLLIHPSLFSAIENQVVLENSLWFLHQIETDHEHICFLATKDNEPQISVKEILNPYIYY